MGAPLLCCTFVCEMVEWRKGWFDGGMVLSDRTMKEVFARGRIVIEPLD